MGGGGWWVFNLFIFCIHILCCHFCKFKNVLSIHLVLRFLIFQYKCIYSIHSSIQMFSFAENKTLLKLPCLSLTCTWYTVLSCPYDSSKWFVCLFGFILPLENFTLIRRRHHYRWRAASLGLCSALTAIKKRGFFSVPYLLWNWTSIIMVISDRHVTLTPITKRLAVELSLPVLTTHVGRSWYSNTQPSACRANAQYHA